MDTAQIQRLRRGWGARWQIFPPQPEAAGDSALLAAWRAAPLTFEPGAPLDAGWKQDDKRAALGQDPTGALFRVAVDHLMRYRFYPPTVMHHTTDFGLANRWMQPGDRVLIRVHVVPGVVDFLGLNVISRAEVTERRAEMAYLTTAAHAEAGEWSLAVAWLPDDTVEARLCSTSKTVGFRGVPPVPQIARMVQKRAHRLGMAYFTELVRRAWAAEPPE